MPNSYRTKEEIRAMRKKARSGRNLSTRRAIFQRYIYLLECENGYFYVGKANFLLRRMREHFLTDTKGSKLTREFKPLKLLHFESIECTDSQLSKYETNLAIRAAKTWGLEKVRGGGLASDNPNLEYRQIQLAQVSKIKEEELKGMTPNELDSFLQEDFHLANKKYRALKKRARKQISSIE